MVASAAPVPTGLTPGCVDADRPYVLCALRRLPSSQGHSRPLFPNKVLSPSFFSSAHSSWKESSQPLAQPSSLCGRIAEPVPCLPTDGAWLRPLSARAQPGLRRCAWSMVQACLVSHRDLCGQGLSRRVQKRHLGAQSSSGGVRRKAGWLGSSSCSPSLPGEPVCCGPGGGGGEAPLLTQPKCAREGSLGQPEAHSLRPGASAVSGAGKQLFKTPTIKRCS